MRKIRLIIALLLVALLVTVGTAVAKSPDALFVTHLTGGPAGADTHGQGQANFRLNGNQLIFVLTLSNLEGDPLAAHIHISAAPGGDGPPVITLCGGGPAPGPVPVPACAGPGAVTDAVILSDDQVSDLLSAVAGDRSYVNVHSTAFPAGEVRGQIAPGP